MNKNGRTGEAHGSKRPKENLYRNFVSLLLGRYRLGVILRFSQFNISRYYYIPV
jgi:hypothetical protein